MSAEVLPGFFERFVRQSLWRGNLCSDRLGWESLLKIIDSSNSRYLGIESRLQACGIDSTVESTIVDGELIPTCPHCYTSESNKVEDLTNSKNAAYRARDKHKNAYLHAIHIIGEVEC